MSISQWSKTPASNTQAVPNGWPDTALVSDILGIGRQHMADIRTWYEDPAWIDFGDTPTYVSATSFTVPADRTTQYVVGRRIKMYGSVMGTFYGNIITSSYDGVALTTITVDIDEGKLLTNNLSQIWYGSENPTNISLPFSVFQAKNILVSGDFRTAPWQQGTTFNSTTTPANNDATYLIDNWILLSDGNDIVDISQDTDLSAKFVVQTVNKQFGMVQFLENAKMQPVIDEGKVSIIIEAKSSGIDNIRCAVLSWTGTSDSPTKDVVATWHGAGTNPDFAANYTLENTPANLALSSSYKDFRLNNINVDSGGVKNLALVFWVDDTSISIGDTLFIRRVKLQVSANAMQFEYISPAEALLNAQSCFFKTFEPGVAPAQNVGSFLGALSNISVGTGNGDLTGMVFYPLPLIKIPAITTYNPIQSNNFWIGSGGVTASPLVAANGRRAIVIENGSATAAFTDYSIHFTADARIGV